MKRKFCINMKFISAILIVCMLFPLMIFDIIANDTIPEELIPLYTDTFSDGALSPNIGTYRFYPGDSDGTNADTLSETLGKLVFDRKKFIWNTDKEYGEPAVRIFATEDHTPVSGDMYIEFSLAKTREVVRLRFCDESGNYLTQIAWEGDTFRFSWRDTNLVSQSTTINAPSNSTVKIGLRANFSSKRPSFTMWVNDVVQAENVISATDLTSKNFSMIQIYTLLYSTYSKSGNFAVDDLGIYRVKDFVPTPEKMIMETGFDSEDLPFLMKKELTGGGVVKIDNGKLYIEKTGEGSSAVGASIYNNLEADSVTGLIGIEYDIERENYNTVQMRSMDPNGNLYYSLSWAYNGLNANYSEDKSMQGDSHRVLDESLLKLHINMMFDTANSTYWLWINDNLIVSEKYSRTVGVSSLCYTMFYLESLNKISIDNYKIYYAIPPRDMRLKFDVESFDINSVMNESHNVVNVVTSQLTLPSVLRYGTSVNWDSSDSDIINPETGAVNRLATASDSPVTLSASFSYGEDTIKKDYIFYVPCQIPDNMDIKQFEVEDIKNSYLISENPDNIKLSLNLLQNGIFGSDIEWTSSDTSTITNSGRVIRPRFDEQSKTVTLTASIGEYKKEFIFKVAPDERPVDPMHTSDEEFFGVWNGSAFSVSPQLNYEISELSDVLACVKNNDYTSARNALLSYFKTREVLPPIGLGNRHTGWVDARADGLLETGEEASYWKGHMIITSDEFEPVTVSIYNPESIFTSKCKTFELISRYNECSSAYILGTGNADLNSVPKLQLKVNGSTRTYTATNTATIRAGKYSQTHINDTSILEAKMFGDFLGDNTSRILLAFDLSDISSSDSITDAQLTVYARKSSTSADNKELWLIDNRDKEWNENTVFWDSLNFNVHNYNGLNGGADWKGARASDVEYAYQAPRFTHARSTMAEYKATGNEKYAYSLLGQVFDIIKDTGAVTPYPRSLDASGRMQQLVPLMNTFKNSPYLTADFCTAFMKYMYKQFEYFPTRVDATGNWREYEQLAVLYATAAYPELSNSQTAKDACVLSWQNALSKSFMPDGSYIEDTGGYHRSSFNMYRDFKKSGISSGVTLPEEFDIRLHKAAYYMALTNGPGGLTLQYGDESGGKSSSNRYSDIADWYDDDELRFIDSFGTSGTKPSWTSYQFPDGRYTIMRSDWKQDAIYLHTNVRGGGGHGHADDNNIILMAGDRRLLVDAGRFTYNTYDPARLYGLSTQGHNTLVINDTSQRMGWTDDEHSVRGNINQWTSNSEFDMLSQSTISYPEHDHTRNIFFEKDGLFVVSDIVKPHNSDSENNYKQYWHMMPEASISADNTSSVIKSNFASGKNIILTCADEVNTYLENGYYDISDGTAVSNNAGMFEKTAVGDTLIDTVMYVSDSKDAKISTNRIATNASETEISAIKITLNENGKEDVYYYMYNYAYDQGATAVFDGFSSDARSLMIRTDDNGDYHSIMMTDGSYVYKDNTLIFSADKATDISAKFDENKLNIITSDSSIDSESVSILCSQTVDFVTFNNKHMMYAVDSGMLHVGTEEENGVREDLECIIKKITSKFVTDNDNTNFVIDNLDFSDSIGNNGSTITYLVNDEITVSENGTITRALTDKPIILTVTASKGKTSISSKLDFYVPGKYNNIGRGELPFISSEYSVSRTVTDTNTAGKTTSAELTDFAESVNEISFTSSYTTKEPGFTCKYNDNLKGDFIYELSFSSDSNALRIRFSDSSWSRKLDVYYLDNKTLAIGGSVTQYHTDSFNGKHVKLTLAFSMNTDSVDVYLDGVLWLDDFKLASSNYKNIQHIMASHHCATILGAWRQGNGTTTFSSFGIYKIADKSSISSIITGTPTYSNNGNVISGANYATVPVVATDYDGETGDAILAYAIYDGNDTKKLVEVETQKIDLNKYRHQEYTICVNNTNQSQNLTQKVFVLSSIESMKPVKKY